MKKQQNKTVSSESATIINEENEALVFNMAHNHFLSRLYSLRPTCIKCGIVVTPTNLGGTRLHENDINEFYDGTPEVMCSKCAGDQMRETDPHAAAKYELSNEMGHEIDDYADVLEYFTAKFTKLFSDPNSDEIKVAYVGTMLHKLQTDSNFREAFQKNIDEIKRKRNGYIEPVHVIADITNAYTQHFTTCPHCGCVTETDEDTETLIFEYQGNGIWLWHCTKCDHHWRATYTFVETNLRIAAFYEEKKQHYKKKGKKGKAIIQMIDTAIREEAIPPELLSKYNASHDFCPYCSTKLTIDDIDHESIDGTSAITNIQCHVCHHVWIDTWKIVRAELIS